MRAFVPLLAAAFAAAATPAGAQSPCDAASAAVLADRPATGRTTAIGGGVCVVPPGGIVVEGGTRVQWTTAQGGSSTLVSYPLPLLRAGVAPRLEFALAPPTQIVRGVAGTYVFPPAGGTADTALSAKWLVVDRPRLQASVGAAYLFPTGNAAFTAGAGTANAGVNAAYVLSPVLAVTLSATLGTAIGNDANGVAVPYAVFAPSVTLAYALDAANTLLAQDGFVSRTSPVGSAGQRAFVAVQHAAGPHLALDLELERNLTPLAGTDAWAVGGGVVWLINH